MLHIKTRSFIIFTLLFISIASTTWYTLSKKKLSLEKEESLIYLSIFKPSPDMEAFPNVVTVSKPATCNISTKRSYDIPLQLIKALLLTNNEKAKPVKLTSLKDIVPLLSWSDTKKLNQDGILQDFNPLDKTLFYLSRAGFNPERTRAIVCIENKSSRHNEGFIIQLRKIEDSWKTIQNTYIKFL